MAYADQHNARNRTTAIAGVIAIHVALGAIVITGLSTVAPFITEDETIVGTNVEVELPPPPPEPDDPKPTDTQPKQQKTYVPDREFTFDTDLDISTTNETPDEDVFVFDPDPIGTEVFQPRPLPSPTPTLDPIAARPSNNPGGWVTDADYQSSWIRRELQGVVGFAVTIDADGRVADCRVTRSSGHSQLDDATCRLVSQRARFAAARDGKGIKVPGRYANSVRWELPE